MRMTSNNFRCFLNWNIEEITYLKRGTDSNPENACQFSNRTPSVFNGLTCQSTLFQFKKCVCVCVCVCLSHSNFSKKTYGWILFRGCIDIRECLNHWNNDGLLMVKKNDRIWWNFTQSSISIFSRIFFSTLIVVSQVKSKLLFCSYCQQYSQPSYLNVGVMHTGLTHRRSWVLSPVRGQCSCKFVLLSRVALRHPRGT